MPVTVIDIIKPKNAQPFPIVEDAEFLGGFRTVADHTERDAIPSERRKLGMWVYTRSDGKVWTLVGGLLNANWTEVAFGGGGGGGVKLYADESVLLAASDAEGTIAFAQDTKRYWFRRMAQWRVDPSNETLTRTSTIRRLYVDAVSGDDGDGADGSVAHPVRTLTAALRRIAGQSQGPISFDSQNEIILKPGTHTIPPTGDPLIYYQTMLGGHVRIKGELTTLATFTVDSYSGQGLKIKKTGAADWTPNAFVGEALHVVFSFYGYPYIYNFPIMSNTADELTVAWSPDSSVGGIGWLPPPAPGTVLEIVRRPVLTGNALLVEFDTYVEFVDITFSGPSGPYVASFGSIYFSECRFDGTSGNTTYAWQRSYSGFYNCHWINSSSGAWVVDGQVSFNEPCCTNSVRMFDGWDARVAVGGAIHSDQSYNLFYCESGCTILAESVSFHTMNMGGNATVFNLQWPPNNARMLYALGVWDGKAPGTYFSLNPGCELVLGNDVTTAVYPTGAAPNKAILFDGGPFGMSFDELRNSYGGDYDHGHGERAYLLTPNP
jgi:hypothetical protein